MRTQLLRSGKFRFVDMSKVAAVKEKARKPKLVRDSFTMPEAEYEVLGQVKKACLNLSKPVRYSKPKTSAPIHSALMRS